MLHADVGGISWQIAVALTRYGLRHDYKQRGVTKMMPNKSLQPTPGGAVVCISRLSTGVAEL